MSPKFLVKSIIRINIRFQGHSKNYFNCSIPEFRKRHSNACSEGKNPIQIEPSIERVPHTRIAYLKLERTHHVSHSFSVLWKQVLQFSESYGLLSKGCKYVSMTLDYPFITLEEQSRFYGWSNITTII